MSLAHSPSIPLDGLLLCVDAANTKIPAAGNVTLTRNNGLAVPANGYYTFDGTDDSLSLDTNTILNVTYGGKTIIAAIWIDPSWTATGQFKCMIGTSTGLLVRNINLYLYRDSSGLRLHYSTSNGSTNLGSFSDYLTMTTGQWYIVGVSQKEDGTLSYYQNGQAVGNASHTLHQYNPTAIESLGGGDSFFPGRIAFWHVYNRGLTDAEMKQSFNALRGRFGL